MFAGKVDQAFDMSMNSSILGIDGVSRQRSFMVPVSNGMKLSHQTARSDLADGDIADFCPVSDQIAETAIDVMVVGAGPGGLATAEVIVKSGGHVVVFNERIAPGDSISDNSIPMPPNVFLLKICKHPMAGHGMPENRASCFMLKRSSGAQKDVLTGAGESGCMDQMAREGMTMMVVTHEMGFARTVANRVIFIDRGEIVDDCPADAFFVGNHNPRTENSLSKILNH